MTLGAISVEGGAIKRKGAGARFDDEDTVDDYG
jgi:hypothetical protein